MAGEKHHSGRTFDVLPSNVKPLHYALQFTPDFLNFTYQGQAAIELDVVEQSHEISLHTLELDLISTSLEAVECSLGRRVPIKTRYESDSNVTTFTFQDALKSGTAAVLRIDFKGSLNDKNAGFFRSSYVAEDGSSKYVACTQMEPTDARRVFPCFDEPALKATFEIVCVVDKDLTCLSNMNVMSESDVGEGKKRLAFAKSPPMSTYIVALAIGDLKCIETNAFRVPIRIYTLPGKEQDGKYALELSVRTMNFYEETFGVPYPLPKIDMVALPDFPGGMENWGLVLYKTNVLLFNEQTSSINDKKRVAEVVQHELAHQWFGNLVTMDFWDGLWLNEGFATWMSWYSTDIFYPDWHVWQAYITKTLDRALQLDSLRSSHPVEVAAASASEIMQNFDAITYNKGSCVIRMLSKYIGEDVFMEGIRQYLKRHAYGNTKTSDLWAALSDASGKDIAEIMNVWTKKVGFPVITVREDSDGIHIQQHRYLQTADVTPEEDKTIYPVLISLSIGKEKPESIILDSRSKKIPLKDLDFFKLNHHHSGIFRTLYSPERLLKFGEAMASDLLDVEDRVGLISDAAALAASGYQKTSAFLGLLKNLGRETNSIVWTEIITRLTAMEGAWMFRSPETKAALKHFTLDLVSTRTHDLGWKFKASDDLLLQEHKSEMFRAAGLAGDQLIVDAARQMVSSYIKGDKSAIHPNLRRAVYAVALEKGTQADFDALVTAMQTTTSADEREDLLRGLGHFRSPSVVEKVLSFVLGDEITDKDFYLPLIGLGTDPTTAQNMWTWSKAYQDVLEAKAGDMIGMTGVIMMITTRNLGTAEDVADVETFYAARETAKFDQKLAQALDGIRAKVAWVERDARDVEGWLREKGYLK